MAIDDKKSSGGGIKMGGGLKKSGGLTTSMEYVQSLGR
jgi:hypothetical protein